MDKRCANKSTMFHLFSRIVMIWHDAPALSEQSGSFHFSNPRLWMVLNGTLKLFKMWWWFLLLFICMLKSCYFPCSFSKHAPSPLSSNVSCLYRDFPRDLRADNFFVGAIDYSLCFNDNEEIKKKNSNIYWMSMPWKNLWFFISIVLISYQKSHKILMS